MIAHLISEGVDFQDILEFPRLIVGIVLNMENPRLQRLRTSETEMAGYQQR